jgi:hypothetical protein
MRFRIYSDFSCVEHCDLTLPNAFEPIENMVQLPHIFDPISRENIDYSLHRLVQYTFTYRDHRDLLSRVLISELQNGEVYEEGSLLNNRLLVLRRVGEPVTYSLGQPSSTKCYLYDLLDGEKTITNYPYHPWCDLVMKLTDGTGKWKRF